MVHPYCFRPHKISHSPCFASLLHLDFIPFRYLTAMMLKTQGWYISSAKLFTKNLSVVYRWHSDFWPGTVIKVSCKVYQGILFWHHTYQQSTWSSPDIPAKIKNVRRRAPVEFNQMSGKEVRMSGEKNFVYTAYQVPLKTLFIKYQLSE